MADRIIDHDGDTWRVLSRGTQLTDGRTFVHLASTTHNQKDGRCPVQICDFVDLRDPITAHYQDRASSGQAALTAHR